MSSHVLLIHGTWGNGENWSEVAAQFEARGFTVHAPTLRHHGHPADGDLWNRAQQVAKVGLLDYVADLVALVEQMDSPPIILGHSLGALLAQLVAARVPNQGVILLGPAPTGGMFTFHPSMVRLWGRYLPQWIGGRPMYPVSKGPWAKSICNATDPQISESFYATLCAESGTAYRQMVLWFLDPKRSAMVDFAAVDAPVLVVTGSEDRCTSPRIGRAIAAKYGPAGTLVELPGSDHMMTAGPMLAETFAAIDRWLAAPTARDAHPTVASPVARLGAVG